MVANPRAVWKSTRTKYSFIILMPLVMHHCNTAMLKLKKFFSIKIFISDYFESDDYKLIRFQFGLTSATITSWCSWFFRQKLALGQQREFLYSNETLEHWPRGTFAAHRNSSFPPFFPPSSSLYYPPHFNSSHTSFHRPALLTRFPPFNAPFLCPSHQPPLPSLFILPPTHFIPFLPLYLPPSLSTFLIPWKTNLN